MLWGSLIDWYCCGLPPQVFCLAFSPSLDRVVTASADGLLKVWNINVRYALSEDPKVCWRRCGGGADWPAVSQQCSGALYPPLLP